MNKDFYNRYISSEDWKVKRRQILERDGNCCQTCLSNECLEVHHKTYERLGNEALKDLITLCHDCHEAITTVIRRRKYSGRVIEVVDVDRRTPTLTIEVKTNGTADIEIQTHIRSTPAPSQRADRRSLEQVCQGDEANQFKARQDGRRF
jgi:hypothetical protein